jgi:RNA polymerase sigma factor (sigma-70 family)
MSTINVLPSRSGTEPDAVVVEGALRREQSLENGFGYSRRAVYPSFRGGGILGQRPARSPARRTFMSESAEVSTSTEEQRLIEAVYEQHRDLLEYLARRRFRIPMQDAQPLVHDAFVSYLRHRSRVQDERAWLVGAMYNLCRDYWSRRGDGPAAAVAVPPKAVIDDVCARVDAASVLARLSERCREVLRRRFVEGYSTNELASWLATTVANAKVIVHRCKTKALALFSAKEGRRV